jgi:hypothetical protein
MGGFIGVILIEIEIYKDMLKIIMYRLVSDWNLGVCTLISFATRLLVACSVAVTYIVVDWLP